MSDPAKHPVRLRFSEEHGKSSYPAYIAQKLQGWASWILLLREEYQRAVPPHCINMGSWGRALCEPKVLPFVMQVVLLRKRDLSLEMLQRAKNVPRDGYCSSAMSLWWWSVEGAKQHVVAVRGISLLSQRFNPQKIDGPHPAFSQVIFAAKCKHQDIL